ncbi:MAG: hypothetical protein QF599_03780 [Planctomycetota bacterium]|jgi:hypothetical protein|nr:hypothetical protein [Planctomycetota bacterium]MDP6955074.1 hypothetical protein [Planctomycetota bacterium]
MHLPSALDILAKTPVLLLTGAITLVIPLQMAGTLAPLGGTAGLVELQLTPDVDSYLEIVTAWGPAGRRALASHFSGDFIFMLAYALCGLGLLRRLTEPAQPGPVTAGEDGTQQDSCPRASGQSAPIRMAQRLLPLPALIAISDLAETLFHGLLLANWQAPSQAVLTLAYSLNVIKWSLAALFLTLLLILLGARVARGSRG